ncbi:MAG TPA: zinc transporter ZupT [Candidatus Woesebacteria bacterium]|nr:zinc transporter ZupT [Candidatus Woesebacteria bacterium]
MDIRLPLLLTFLAGISTVLGAFVVFFLKDFKKSYLSFFLGMSAGTMVYLSFMELLPLAVESISFRQANITFFIGILLIGLVDKIIPHHYINYYSKRRKECNKLMITGFMVAVGLTIHNFPEGITVFMSSLGGVRLGFLIAFATALHNIPEGMAVATPIYFATNSKRKAFGYSFLAGIAEPIGAFFAYLIFQQYFNSTFLSYIFAFVAGVMVYISFDELLPTCFKHSEGHTAIFGIIIGMLIMALSLSFL